MQSWFMVTPRTAHKRSKCFCFNRISWTFLRFFLVVVYLLGIHTNCKIPQKRVRSQWFQLRMKCHNQSAGEKIIVTKIAKSENRWFSSRIVKQRNDEMEFFNVNANNNRFENVQVYLRCIKQRRNQEFTKAKWATYLSWLATLEYRPWNHFQHCSRLWYWHIC